MAPERLADIEAKRLWWSELEVERVQSWNFKIYKPTPPCFSTGYVALEGRVAETPVRTVKTRLSLELDAENMPIDQEETISAPGRIVPVYWLSAGDFPEPYRGSRYVHALLPFPREEFPRFLQKGITPDYETVVARELAGLPGRMLAERAKDADRRKRDEEAYQRLQRMASTPRPAEASALRAYIGERIVDIAASAMEEEQALEVLAQAAPRQRFARYALRVDQRNLAMSTFQCLEERFTEEFDREIQEILGRKELLDIGDLQFALKMALRSTYAPEG